VEILRLPESTSIQASFDVSLANTLYTASYTDLITGTSYSASATSNNSKVVSFTLNSRYMSYSGDIDFNIYRSGSAVYSDQLTIIRPYCSINKIKEKLNITTAQAIQFESTARSIIEAEAGPFSFVKKEKEVSGMGMDYLPVNERIETLYKMYENGSLIHDSSDTELNLYKISVDKSSIVPIDQIQNKVEYQKVWRDRYLDVSFASGYDYLVEADFGYRVIPNDIQKACELLITDLANNNNQYINKYIEMFDNVEFRVQFSKEFAKGTGNMIVDSILSKYKNRIIPGVI
jgi:hypothetical protein